MPSELEVCARYVIMQQCKSKCLSKTAKKHIFLAMAAVWVESAAKKLVDRLTSTTTYFIYLVEGRVQPQGQGAL